MRCIAIEYLYIIIYTIQTKDLYRLRCHEHAIARNTQTHYKNQHEKNLHALDTRVGNYSDMRRIEWRSYKHEEGAT